MDVVRTKSKQGLLNKRNTFICVGFLFVFIFSYMVFSLEKAVPTLERDGTWVDIALLGDMVHEIRSSGRLVPRNARWEASSVVANVQEVLLEPGVAVEQGAVIVLLENPALGTKLNRAKAAWAGAEADLAARRSALMLDVLQQDSRIAEFEAKYEISKIEAEATGKAYAIAIVSKVEFDSSQIILEQNRRLLELSKQRKREVSDSVQAQLRAAEAELDQAKGALRIAEQEVEALQVRAGISGVLQQVSVEVGQQVTVGESIAYVAQPTPLRARLRVPEIQAKDLAIGLKVLVDTHSGIVEGELEQINPSVKNGSVFVFVKFDEKLPANARPDLSIEGRIIVNKISNVVSIARPAMALKNGVGKLFVMAPDSDIARRKDVLYGTLSSDRVEIVRGISPGEQVIISDVTRWNDYEEIRLK